MPTTKRGRAQHPDSEDELDFLSSNSPTLVASSSNPSRDTTPGLSKRVLRPKPSNGQLLKLGKTQNSAMKRKNTSANVAQERAGKKARIEDKKQITLVINSKKAAIEAARRRWLHKHRDLFTPLLPPNSHFFTTLEHDLKASTDTGTYKPLHELEKQPALVQGGQLKDYQLHGLSWLAWMYENGMNCILGDEMGLGKTLQTLSLLAYVKEHAKGHVEPHLIICPLSVVETWLNEIRRWVPSFKTMRFHAQESERKRLKEAVRAGDIEFDICVATYESYVAEDTWFKSRRWTYIVLDEGHRIKNAGTIVANKLQHIGCLHRLILTGTPVQNNLVELWGLLHWLYPSIFVPATERLFREAFSLEKGAYSLPFLKATEQLLSTIMLRRTKDSVDIAVPPREELTVFLPMAEAQRFWTYRLLTRLDSVDLQEIFTADMQEEKENEGRREVQAMIAAQNEKAKAGQSNQGNQWKRLMNLLMQLRKVCDHPYLLPDAEPTPYELGEHVVASSSKLVFLDKLFADILPKGERVLVFSQFATMLDLLEDFLVLRGIKYARLDGSTCRPRRTLDVKLFQQDESPFQVFLISTKAGGLGINLTKASTVVMFDSDWNPQNDLQAIARAHRIGQTKTVKVYRLICQGSVEDQMLDRIRRKLFLSIKVMQSRPVGEGKEDQLSALKTAELMSILRKGSSALARTDGAAGPSLAQFLKAPVAEILQASRERDDVRAVRLQKELGEDVQDTDALGSVEDEERAMLSGVAQVQSRLFEGKVVKRAKPHANNKDIAADWEAVQKRARQERIVIVDGFEVLSEYLPSTSTNVRTTSAPPKRKRRQFDWEDWCIYCRDGGELTLCNSCPRVFHAECHGLSKTKAAQMPMLVCPQHRCCGCDRNTADAGNMLFRCQTCINAFCEDCLPPGEIDAVGDTLPEFVLRGYGEISSAYFIRCHGCKERFETDPAFAQQWEEEFRETQKKLEALNAT
ncbi:hypothetical protein PsYK624_077330 [Phanerochaete sordida]|uniref:Uncharacterized protein n=1 Tax=Phanerochaete sordida TaxID=48140 RepID=A0A9P3GB00_9APHY|nr:hypothetical protein PsYK624_077330 [Phanerochaete sordida]